MWRGAERVWGKKVGILRSRHWRWSEAPTVVACILLVLAPVQASFTQDIQPGTGDDAEPERSLFRQHAPGLLVRTAYRAETPAELAVEVWDLLVGPGKTSEAVRFPGTAVVTVRTGSGRVVIDGKSQEVRIGESATVAEGAEISFDNSRSEGPLALRAILISQP